MSVSTTQVDAGLEIFIEQAEYIEDDEFRKWTIDHPDEELIVRKLTQAGAKLITGPRGCGKTTLLKKAYFRMTERAGEGAFPVYVNYKASLKLEPFYKAAANATLIFQQWLVYKVYSGIYETLETLKEPGPPLRFTREKVASLIKTLELGQAPSLHVDDSALPADLERDIALLVEELGYRRAVLLLDDAAHAFSTEQQRDFFEFFRAIKSKSVSPKAAVYPGVTIYSPTFHVGHDAEEVDVWLKPDGAGYLPFMRRLLEQRLPVEVWQQLSQNESLLDLLCYAAFGVPRSLLTMVRSLYRGDEEEIEAIAVEFTRLTTLKAVRRAYENTMSIFGSLRLKLPMYQKFIDAGRGAFDACVQAIKQYNKCKPVDEQSVTIGIKRPVPQELTKVLGYFQYAGLLLPRGEISRGEKGTFELYVVHYAALIDQNALLVRKSVNIAAFVQAFQKRHAKEFTRLTSRTLLGTEDAASVLTLALPPCQVCKTPRISEDAKFCLKCGSPLIAVSTFEALVENDISELPLTEKRVGSIKAQSSIRKIKDILLDHEHRQLRSIKRIGPYWAKRIYSYAEEYLA